MIMHPDPNGTDPNGMGTRSGCCRLIRKTREGLRKNPGWRKARTAIQKDVNSTCLTFFPTRFVETPRRGE